jgi:hypothetical protein
MIVKLNRPTAAHLRWFIHDKSGRFQRWVSDVDLPSRVRARASERSYWFASLDVAQRLVLHDRVPAQRW